MPSLAHERKYVCVCVCVLFVPSVSETATLKRRILGGLSFQEHVHEKDCFLVPSFCKISLNTKVSALLGTDTPFVLSKPVRDLGVSWFVLGAWSIETHQICEQSEHVHTRQAAQQLRLLTNDTTFAIPLSDKNIHVLHQHCSSGAMVPLICLTKSKRRPASGVTVLNCDWFIAHRSHSQAALLSLMGRSSWGVATELLFAPPLTLLERNANSLSRQPGSLLFAHEVRTLVLVGFQCSQRLDHAVSLSHSVTSWSSECYVDKDDSFPMLQTLWVVQTTTRHINACSMQILHCVFFLFFLCLPLLSLHLLQLHRLMNSRQ